MLNCAWLDAETASSAEEEDFTRIRDRLNADRRRLPMIEIDKEYRFEAVDGTPTLRVFRNYSSDGRGGNLFRDEYPQP